MSDRTINVGYVHVGKRDSEGRWVCAENCPHPDHDGDKT